MSTYTSIASQTLASTATSVTFSSIPQGYTDLRLVVCGAVGTAIDPMVAVLNGDTGANYSYVMIYHNATVPAGLIEANQSSLRFGYMGPTQSMSTLDLISYSNGTTYKVGLGEGGSTQTPSPTRQVATWRNTAAITSIKIFQYSSYNFAVGTTFSIYGIQAGNKDQKATGGNIVTTDGTYMYHAFTSSGSFIPNESLTADYLVVGGGGGGGYAGYGCGGGGGGGGLRSTVTASGGTPGTVESALSLTAKSYTVSIGAGGTRGGNYPQTPSTAGGNSVFSTITSIGGGNGASQGDSVGGGTGGSGGGEAAFGTAGIGAGTQYQGYSGGGRANTGGNSAAGGGGGAAAAGSAGSGGGGQGGVGGAGRAVSILGSSVTYAGGGGGGKESGTAGVGGAGGGGAGNSSQSSNATDGTVSLGGGGGGQGYSGGGTNNTFGGNGGSGIVIIRYLL